MIASLSQLDTCGWSYSMILRLMPSVFILQLIIIERFGCSQTFGQWQLMIQETYSKWVHVYVHVYKYIRGPYYRIP